MKRFLIITLFLFTVSGCTRAVPLEKFRQSRSLMATFVQLDVCAPPSAAASLEPVFDKVWERLEEISWRMNVYDDRSDIAKITENRHESVVIPEDTYFVLQKAKEFSRLSGGAFDVTVWPLIKLWKAGAKSSQLPSAAEIDTILAQIGMDKVELLENNTVVLKSDIASIDLGGIAKGYAVDEAARIFREEGYTNFYIDAGGDVYGGGLNCKRKKWRIGIRNPKKKDEIVAIVGISNQAVTTSGNYEQFYEIEGKTYSHIIDPRTGYPQTSVISSTVIAPNATDADALSTALTVLDQAASEEMFNQLSGEYVGYVFRESEMGIAAKALGDFKKYRIR